MKKFCFSIAALILVMNFAVIASAAPVSIWDASIVRSYRGPNSIGWPDGDRLVVACRADPITSGDGDTVIVATNPDTGYSMTLFNVGGTDPNEYGRSIDYDPAKTGSWTLTATNGSDTATDTAIAIGDVERMPFLRNVMITGNGVNPTVSWTVPSGTGADSTYISVIDGNTGIRLWSGPTFELDITSFTFPNGVFQPDYSYVIRTRLHDNVGDTIDGRNRSRSESFHNFTPTEEGEPQAVFLPTVSADPDPTDEFGAAFSFDVDVEDGVPCFIDPFVAIGYDYEVGTEDIVRFASVTLPEIGDNLFDLYLFNGSSFYLAQKNLVAGETFDFSPGGVKRFRVLGIAKSDELDPNDTTAFITELTFSGTGPFTGTMTPIIALVPDSYTGQICSTLGDNNKRSFLDVDIYKFEAAADEGVLVRLEKDGDDHTGERVTLVLRDRIRKVRVFEIDCGTLPSEIKIRLPAAGKYRVIVAEQPKFWHGKRFQGDYCLSLRSSEDAFSSLEPTRWVE